MKILIFLLLLSNSCDAQFRVNGRSISHTLPSLPTLPDTVRIYVTTGQSNANSHGENLSAYYTASPLKTTHWDTATKNFEKYSNIGIVRTGFNTQTAGLQSALHNNDSIYCIKIVQGSLAITNWSNTNGEMKLALDSAMVQALRLIRARGKVPKVMSTIWLQGEQDCVIGTPQATYQARLDSVITRYRNLDPIMATIQWVIVKLREDSYDPTYQTGAVANINAAYINLKNNKENVVLIRPEDIGAVFTASNDIHYSNSSYILIANAWSALIQ